MAMDAQQRGSHQWLCGRGVELLRCGDRLRALNMFEKSIELQESPECRSYLGMLLATERGLIRKGIELCRASIDEEPGNPLHYLNLSRLLYSIERKTEAVDILHKARSLPNSELVEKCKEEMESWSKHVGMRRRPIFSFLARSHPLNKYTGLMLRRIGFR